MRFNLLTSTENGVMDFAKKITEKHNVKILEVRYATIENDWGQVTDMAYVFRCKGNFENMLELKKDAQRKFKIYEGLSLI